MRASINGMEATLKRTNTMVRLPDDLHYAGKLEAARRRMSLQALVSEAVEEFLKQRAPDGLSTLDTPVEYQP